MGVNRYKWVWMGVDGCVGAQGARGAQKQGKKGTFRPWQTLISALWPGKFPRTSCFWWYGLYGFLWVWEGVYGFLWVHWGSGTRAERKTTEKEAKMIVSCSIFDACQGEKKQEVGRDGCGGQIGSCGGKVSKKGMRINFMCLYQQNRRQNIGNNTKTHQK